MIRLALCNLAGGSERRVRSRAPDMLVDATFHAIADAGSIPAVSTNFTDCAQARIRLLCRRKRILRSAKERAPNLASCGPVNRVGVQVGCKMLPIEEGCSLSLWQG